MIAQTTQSTIWTTPEVSAALTGMIVIVLGALGVSLVAVIKAAGARLEAKLAQGRADAAQGTANLAANHAQRIDAQVTQIATNMPAPGERR